MESDCVCIYDYFFVGMMGVYFRIVVKIFNSYHLFCLRYAK
jgi:hypothetical protein